MLLPLPLFYLRNPLRLISLTCYGQGIDRVKMINDPIVFASGRDKRTIYAHQAKKSQRKRSNEEYRNYLHAS